MKPSREPDTGHKNGFLGERPKDTTPLGFTAEFFGYKRQ